MSLLLSDEKVKQIVSNTIEQWLNDNKQQILDNISNTISKWIDENKESIKYPVIR
jgi:hypothetical protein